jgi:6-phosphogluconolactonase (cycloisomerase 2 family)
VAPDGSQVFTAAYTDDSVAVFQRDQATGGLTFSQGFVDGQAGCDGLNGADCVEISLDGKSVCVSGYYDNSVTVFSRDPSTGSLVFLAVHKDGVSGVDGLRYARGISISADGLSVYVTGSSDDAIASFRRDPSTGNLTFTSFMNGVDGARGLAVSPDGRNCYVTGSSANNLAVFNRARE